MNGIKISLHFDLNEFQCPCCRRVMLDERLLERLEALRVLWGKPIHITSGYRCERHNKEVGGVPNSLHTKGRAVDIAVEEREQGKILTIARLLGLRAIPYTKRGFVHLDIGGEEDGHLSDSFKSGFSDSGKFLPSREIGEGDKRLKGCHIFS